MHGPIIKIVNKNNLSAEKIVEKTVPKKVQTSTIELVSHIIENAHQLRASDVHVDPQGNFLRLRFRIDGVLQDMENLPLSMHSEIISRIKILAGLRTDEHQSPQDGRFRITTESGTIVDLRVSIVPTYDGENVVLRLLSDQSQEFSLTNMGFEDADRAKILRAVHRPHGMILVTGPTGSGKTTTLYTLIKLLNIPEVSIVTIEDPIEYAIADVKQIQVNSRADLTFANGLRSILRQDPNIIMVGEIRDRETAGIAINTALTGHLLLSTLHTNDAATTLPRLLDMKIDSYLIASTISLVIAQRLVRKICSNCKEVKILTKAEFQSISGILSEKVIKKEDKFFRGAGCYECNQTGYKGRIGVFEVMVIDDVIRNAILRKKDANEIKNLAINTGMASLTADGLVKAKAGQTTIEEVLKILYD